MRPLAGKKKCLFHTYPEKARELGARGGRRRAIFNPANLEPLPAPKTASDLRLLLATTISEVRAARLDPKTANSIAVLSAAYLNALEVAELEARVRALEAKQELAPRVQ
jgi:hypothetical protein